MAISNNVTRTRMMLSGMSASPNASSSLVASVGSHLPSVHCKRFCQSMQSSSSTHVWSMHLVPKHLHGPSSSLQELPSPPHEYCTDTQIW
eukprot:1774522-Rhodomonas_salina.2